MFTSNLFEDVWKLLDGRNNDFLAALDETAKVARAFGVPDGRADLKEILDGIVQLTVARDRAI